jgi:hypothetical protein
MLPLLVISLIVYQFGLAWMWQVTEATSIPYASVCLMAAVAFQSLSWLHTRRIPFAAHGFLAAQVCALVLITAHALVLIPLIGPRYGFSTESLTGVVASTSGFLLFAGLVASKLSVPGAAMRFKLALSVVLLVVTASTCSRVELLREITPPGISAFPGMP